MIIESSPFYLLSLVLPFVSLLLVRASASGPVNLGFDSESGQTNDSKIGIHSFPA